MKPVFWDEPVLKLVDQTKLPNEYIENEYNDYIETAKAIKTMIVRGAPAIGVTAGYGIYLGARQYCDLPKEQFLINMENVFKTLAETRPTAVNLFWAIDRMKKLVMNNEQLSVYEIVGKIKTEADAICDEDIQMCKMMGKYGAELINQGDTILTHCNAGALATADYGTALGVIRAAHDMGKNIKVFADETRPFLQGARLTAYELHHDGIPVTLITDNMAGYFMKQGKIDCVVVGADRIANNGDVANKIGTYSVAVLAKEHGIPFYVAAPTSTFDITLSTGEEIPIEQRDIKEVTHIGGKRIAPEGIDIMNPAFDVTPNDLITAIITEKGVIRAPYKLENIINP